MLLAVAAALLALAVVLRSKKRDNKSFIVKSLFYAKAMPASVSDVVVVVVVLGCGVSSVAAAMVHGHAWLRYGDVAVRPPRREAVNKRWREARHTP